MIANLQESPTPTALKWLCREVTSNIITKQCMCVYSNYMQGAVCLLRWQDTIGSHYAGKHFLTRCIAQAVLTQTTASLGEIK